MINFGNKKPGIDENPIKEMRGIKLRDGSTMRIRRGQTYHSDEGVVYGALQAYREIVGGEMLVGELRYSFPGVENARLDSVVLNPKAPQLIGIGSAMLGFFLVDALVDQRRRYVLATSRYDPVLARFMQDNGFEVTSFKHRKEVRYSIYANDEVKMREIRERRNDLARVAEYEEEYGYFS